MEADVSDLDPARIIEKWLSLGSPNLEAPEYSLAITASWVRDLRAAIDKGVPDECLAYLGQQLWPSLAEFLWHAKKSLAYITYPGSEYYSNRLKTLGNEKDVTIGPEEFGYELGKKWVESLVGEQIDTFTTRISDGSSVVDFLAGDIKDEREAWITELDKDGTPCQEEFDDGIGSALYDAWIARMNEADEDE